MNSLIRVGPYQYIHVLDNNKNVTRLEVGPQTFTKQDHEKVVFGPEHMVVVPLRHYCIVRDPAVRDSKTGVVTDSYGQVQLRHGDKEIRFGEDWQDPFPLLPGEQLDSKVAELPLVLADTALRLVARRDFVDEELSLNRVAGDEWLFVGPATYRPRVEVEMAEKIVASVVLPDHALKLRARRHFRDTHYERERKAGEEWLVKRTGAYLPNVNEEVVGIVRPINITPTTALHVRALDSFTDASDHKRRAGDEWLITSDLTDTHVPDVFEEVIGPVSVTVLSKSQYCIVLDPVGSDGKNQYGARELRVGPKNFFLQPGEHLEGGIREVFVLGREEALLLKANEAFSDTKSDDGKGSDGKAVAVERKPGDMWMIRGPTSYVPPVQVEVLATRKSIPLDENEGIYVRNIKTGQVRTVTGVTYMLESYEELWEKELPEDVEQMLDWSYYKGSESKGRDSKDSKSRSRRDKTRVVVFRVPHNAAVQIYDYKKKKSRVVFGAGLVMLDPDEQFTVLSLSGDKPKRPDAIKTLALMLGPDFMTDIIEVESSDHARLRLQLSYNWQFECDAKTHEEKNSGHTLFQVRDFVGDACKAIASRVRGAVASHTFDEFHKSSAKIIRVAVFGVDERTGKVGNKFLFTANNLAITNIDIQSVEPIDEHTRESLQKSVQLAIEITTRKQERNARHEAEATEQKAKGLIQKQSIANQTSSEEERQKLVAIQSHTAAIMSTGTATAEAEARAEYAEIEVKADVTQAELSSEAEAITARAALEETSGVQTAEVHHQRALADLELKKATALSEIETAKFKALVDAITPQTIKAIARAGPEMQARLLKGLGLKGYLLTDGNSPVNLFNSARGMVGGFPQGGMM